MGEKIGEQIKTRTTRHRTAKEASRWNYESSSFISLSLCDSELLERDIVTDRVARYAHLP